MGEFKVIETQEQLNEVIGERLERERETVKKQYEGFLSPEDVEKKYEGYLSSKQVEEKYKDYISPEEAAKKDATIKNYESASVKARVAHEMGIPYELAGKLSGETYEEIKKDAEIFAKFTKGKKTQPLFEGETQKDSNDEAYKKMLSSMKGE